MNNISSSLIDSVNIFLFDGPLQKRPSEAARPRPQEIEGRVAREFLAIEGATRGGSEIRFTAPLATRADLPLKESRTRVVECLTFNEKVSGSNPGVSMKILALAIRCCCLIIFFLQYSSPCGSNCISNALALPMQVINAIKKISCLCK